MSEEKKEELENNQPKETKKEEPKKEKKSHTLRNFGCLTFLFIIIALCIVGYFRYYYPIAEGVKAGTLNYITLKGYVFKTYEGKLIQEGLRGSKTGGMVQNNEFTFSVEDEKVAKQLESLTEQTLQLHYREYMHDLPWRGYSEFIVDSIYMVSSKGQNVETVNQNPIQVSTNNPENVTNLDEALQRIKVLEEELQDAKRQLNQLQNNASNAQQNLQNGTRRYQRPDGSYRSDDAEVFAK